MSADPPRTATRPFTDRRDAGRQLAGEVEHLRGSDLVVVGLPRGGVPVAAEVAEALGAPLDVLLVRKLGVPFQPELAMGALGEGGIVVVDERHVRSSGVGAQEFDRVVDREAIELDRRADRYRHGRPPADLDERTVLVVDDGVATGSTARAACRVARARGAERVVLAVPVAAPEAVEDLEGEADEVVAVRVPHRLRAVGEWYEDFTQTTDEEVVALLAEADRRVPPHVDPYGDLVPERNEGPRAGPGDVDLRVPPGGRPAIEVDPVPVRHPVDSEVRVPVEGIELTGHLTVPAGARGVVLFAHGSASSRHSPRNRSVARALNRSGIGALLFDLLSVEEEVDRENVFDVALLGDRLGRAARWLADHPDLGGAAIGYFGASTGAAAALWAASRPGDRAAAIVSRGGRPDLAGPALARVRAPTLLIVGSEDRTVLGLNQEAMAWLRCEAHLALVPGATHLFEEPGTLEQVSDLAIRWFTDHLGGAAAVGPDG